MGPNMRGEDEGHGGVYVWESVCAQQGKGAMVEEEEKEEGGCCGIIHTACLSAERKALDRLRQPHRENVCTENTPTHTLRSAATIRAPPP